MKSSLIVGHFDELRDGYATGWAIDKNNPERRLDIEIVLGKQVVGKGCGDIFREDLLSAQLGDGKYGFHIPVEMNPNHGKGTLHAREAVTKKKLLGKYRVRDGLIRSGLLEKIEGSTRPVSAIYRKIGQKMKRLPGSVSTLQGSIDMVIDGQVHGWIFDPQRPMLPLKVEILSGDLVVARGLANIFREDLLALGYGDGCHLFCLPLAPEIIYGGFSHQLRIREAGTKTLVDCALYLFSSTEENVEQAFKHSDKGTSTSFSRQCRHENSGRWQLTAPLRAGEAWLRAGYLRGQNLRGVLREQGGLLAVAAKARTLLVEEGWEELWSRSRQVLSPVTNAHTPSPAATPDTRNDYAAWVRCFDTLNEAKQSRIRAQVAALNNPPKISVVMPVYNPHPTWLSEAIESVRGQIYPHWELCIADDCSPNARIRELLHHYASVDHRIKVVCRAQNGHISAASNSALELATGEWIALLDHDDLLPEHALAYIALAIAEHPDAGLIYSDEDKIDEQGQRFNPYFKCDWNPDLFRSQNMISHLGVYRRSLVDQLGGFRIGFEGSQDYDLALRCVEQLDASQIVHVPRVLYHWRMHAQSTAMVADVKGYAQQAGKKALEEHLARLNIQGRVELTPFLQYRVHYTIPDEPPSVSIIIPSKNAVSLLRQCIESILSKTTYRNYEIIVVDNGSDEPEALTYLDELKSQPKIKVIHDRREFNYSALNNNAASLASTEFICLLNNDIEVITPSWIEEMMSLAIQPGVGAVGARLWYPNETLQHGGVILGIGGVAGHMCKNISRGNRGYFDRSALTQTLSAVTAACMLIRRSIFLEVGRLNETDLAIAFNDIDLCLRVREAGYRNVWTPFAELYHHESVSRGYEDTPEKQARFKREIDFMRKRWGNLLHNDPAYNPNLTLDHEDFGLAWPPRVSY